MSNVTEVDGDNFDNLVLKADKPVLVDFWASWCGPCKMMAPVIDDIAQESTALDVYKCNVDMNQGIAARYGISSIPSFLLFKGGKVVQTVVGAMPKEALLGQLAAHLS